MIADIICPSIATKQLTNRRVSCFVGYLLRKLVTEISFTATEVCNSNSGYLVNRLLLKLNLKVKLKVKLNKYL